MESCRQLLPQSLFFLHLLLLPIFAEGATRVYYLGICEVEWNYAPTGKNIITEASTFLQSGKDRVGSTYKKSVYKQYSDSTYAREIPKPAWLGFLGPIIRAEVGDTIIVHLKNFANRPHTVHPHGVFYKKDSEGSLYPDKSSQDHKEDDAVPPGGNHTYTWTVPEDHSPMADDPTCLTWVYHSHTDAPKDIASGLIGPLLTCKEGKTSGERQRHDVDLDFFLMFSVIDENLSWHLDENIASFCTDPESVDKEDEEFQVSNRMHGGSINGYVYGNLPEMTMCAGDHVAWHLFGMGSETDIHTAFFHGQILTIRGHRSDVASLFPATFVTADMIPSNNGRWLLSCQVNNHLQGKAQSGICPNTPESSMNGTVRKYYIAAKEVQWNYGPSGLDQSTGKSLQEPGSSSEQFFKHSASRIGGTYWKAKYVEYTDSTFQVEKKRSEEETHLGILGPVIKAEVGDTVLVTFANKASWPFSIQPHGVLYGKNDNTCLSWNGASVEPLHNFTYHWTVPQHVGPTASDPPCLTWMYSSAINPIRDTSSGLVGPLVICRPGTLNTSNKQKGIDKEFYLLFSVFDENLSWYLPANMKYYLRTEEAFMKKDEGFRESNRMHGTFDIYCQTSNHYQSGMKARYSVSKCGKGASAPDPQYEEVRTHYIMAQEVEWDYSPDRSWELEHHNISGQESYGNQFLSNENGLLGSKYKKAIYREYTDGTFKIPKNRTSDEEHLGILGPFIWAEVGDVLNIVFKNNATQAYSIHAHGVLERNDGQVEAAKPGDIVTYRWDVPERSGPGPNNFVCVSWVYYSMVDPVKDIYSGLIGPLKVCRKGALGSDGRRKGINREFALLFLVFDENQSWYLEENVKTYAHGNQSKINLQDEEFVESNKMHAINGKLYANLPGLTMHQEDWVNWYLLGMGQEIDVHTVHFHAETFTYRVRISC
uniref:ferroxidase n=1 Tax=Chelonoidis abingdonii TaxID=106734 RepID=A0A8C0H4S1_CHEAB